MLMTSSLCGFPGKRHAQETMAELAERLLDGYVEKQAQVYIIAAV